MGENDTTLESPGKPESLELDSLDLPSPDSKPPQEATPFTARLIDSASLPVPSKPPEEATTALAETRVRDWTELVNPADKFGSLVDASLDKINEIMLYQPTPGSDEYVDIIKTQATLAMGILNTASRVRDTELAKRVDDKLTGILEEVKRVSAELGLDSPVLPGRSARLSGKSPSAPAESEAPLPN